MPKLRFLSVEIENANEETVRALLADLLDLCHGQRPVNPTVEAEDLPPQRITMIADQSKPRPAVREPVAAEPDPRAPRPAAPSNGVHLPKASVKPGMLATEAERRHFQNVHGGKAVSLDEPRKVRPGDLPAELKAMKPGDEFIVSPGSKLSSVSMQIHHRRRKGEIDRRIAAARDDAGQVRVIFHTEAVTG